MKQGYKTTEFWLSLAAVVVGALIASGALVEGSALLKIVSVAASLLAALGYTWSRTKLKEYAPLPGAEVKTPPL